MVQNLCKHNQRDPKPHAVQTAAGLMRFLFHTQFYNTFNAARQFSLSACILILNLELVCIQQACYRAERNKP